MPVVVKLPRRSEEEEGPSGGREQWSNGEAVPFLGGQLSTFCSITSNVEGGGFASSFCFVRFSYQVFIIVAEIRAAMIKPRI